MELIRNSINVLFILKYTMLHCFGIQKGKDELTVSKHLTQADTPNESTLGRNLLIIIFQA